MIIGFFALKLTTLIQIFMSYNSNPNPPIYYYYINGTKMGKKKKFTNITLRYLLTTLDITDRINAIKAPNGE